MSILRVSPDHRHPSRLAVTSARQPRTRVIENFIIIWLDLQSHHFDETSLNQLRSFVNAIKLFSNKEQCLECLSRIEDEQIFLILSDSDNDELLSLFEEVHQVHSLYIFSTKPCQSYEQKKIQGTFNRFDAMAKRLKQDLQQCEQDLTPISIVTSHAIDQLNELDQSFMYSLLIKETLLEMNYDEKAKQDLIEFSRIQYANNPYQLHLIEEFEREYVSAAALWWYRRDSFVYSMLSKASRTQDTEMMIKMGFFIRDLHEQIHSSLDPPHALTAYRGHGISNHLFEELFKSQGGLLSFNNFLSVTLDRQMALDAAKQRLNNPTNTSILFQIDASNSFVSLDRPRSNYSRETKTKQILFSLHTVFRIADIQQIDERLWQVNLSLTTNDDEQLTRLREYSRKASRGETGMHRMAKLMLVMGKIDKAKEIYAALLETTRDDDENELAHLHHQLAYLYDQKDEFTKSIQHYEQSLNLYLTYLPSNDLQLSPAYSNIGLILKKQGNLESALEYLQHALNIDLINQNTDQLEMAIRYTNIGGVLDAQGKRREALETYEHALEIERLCLPSCHLLIGATHHNIGLVYYSMQDYPTALQHFQKTLEIEQKSFPSDHPSLTTTHTNIAGVFEDLHQYKEATEHAEKAVQIVRNTLGSEHPQVVMLQDYLDQLREKQNQQALS